MPREKTHAITRAVWSHSWSPLLAFVWAALPVLAAGCGERCACAREARLAEASCAAGSVAFASRVAELGPRPAATSAEQRVAGMVAAELEALGLEVELEPFAYQSFALETSQLELGGIDVKPVTVGFNPFRGRYSFAGEAVVVTSPEQASQALEGRIVVTNHPLMQFMIAEFSPSLVVCVSPEALDVFSKAADHDAKLELGGRDLELRSLNVVARYPSRRPGTRQILVTSHLDAYQESPGANDNGTGLGLMIELARVFAEQAGRLRVPITFVAFGAEENGSIGSRAYIERHIGELADIRAVVNLDTLGGARGPVIATRPAAEPEPEGAPRIRVPEELRNRAWEGPNGLWKVLHPEILSVALASRYPAWLQSVVEESAADLGIELVHLDLISDHRSFALAGVPAISIQSKEHTIHSAEDTRDKLVPETIASAAGLAAEILCRLQDSWPSPAASRGR